jgi:PAS domain S-box-containing protein/diguanylate cyclase (GGDEF)-like protein
METGRDANGLKSLNRHALEQIIAESSAGILVADAQKPRLPVVYANPAYERLTGFSAAELTGRPWELLASDAGTAEDLERLRAAIASGEPCSLDVMERCKDGSLLASQISVTPLHNGRGEVRYVLCLQHPPGATPAAVSAAPQAHNGAPAVATLPRARTHARAKVATAERIDPATGLLKFTCFQETLRRDLALARYDQRFVTLMVLEVVEFDVYRQTFGGKTADSCQRMIGAQITRTLRRASDLSARYDDAILVAAVVGQEPEEIQPLADQIVEHVRQLGLHNPRGKLGRYLNVRATVFGCAPGAYEDPAPAIVDALSGARGGGGRLRAVLA